MATTENVVAMMPMSTIPATGVLWRGCTLERMDGSAPSWANVKSPRDAAFTTAVTNTMKATVTAAFTR